MESSSHFMTRHRRSCSNLGQACGPRAKSSPACFLTSHKLRMNFFFNFLSCKNKKEYASETLCGPEPTYLVLYRSLQISNLAQRFSGQKSYVPVTPSYLKFQQQYGPDHHPSPCFPRLSNYAASFLGSNGPCSSSQAALW